MTKPGKLGKSLILVLLASLPAANSGCDVTANPFEFLDVAAACTDESDPACSGTDAGNEVDAGNNRPCVSSKDCVGGYVCRSHLCVLTLSDGGFDGQPSPDSAGDFDDDGALDGSCIERFEVNPKNPNFGMVTTGCGSKDLPVVFTNNDCPALSVASLSFIPEPSPFSLVRAPMPPFSLEPGVPMVIILKFNPAFDNGTETATLHIETSVGNLDVPLRGTATSSSEVLDSFVQGSPPSSSFHLSRWPDPATIEVKVNGVGVPADGCNGWSYDETGNSVVFGPGAVPAPGAAITVAYDAMCF